MVIPFGLRLYVKKELCPRLGIPFRRSTELAAELIWLFDLPEGMKVRVLFDSFYLCRVVLAACKEKGFSFFSTLKDNRNLLINGRKVKLGTYKKSAFRRGKKRNLKLRKAKGRSQGTLMWIWVGCRSSGWGKCELSSRERTGKARCLEAKPPT